jgi:hypothetical protein
MRRILLLLTAAMLVAVMAVATASPAMAQLAPHRHLLDTPGTEDVEIFQGFCRGAAPEGALENVHENVHLGEPTEAFATNPVDEVAAPCA